MNLLDTIVPNNEPESDYYNGKILFKDFRDFQYSLIENFLKISLDYLSSQNENYLEITNISLTDKFTYYGVNNNELLQIEVEVKNKIKNTTKTFVKTYIPKLIDGSIFILNENIYTPTIYILDKPIIVKSGSIKLYSLFNSLTIYAKQNVCIFVYENIPLSYFLQLFINDTNDEYLYDKIVKKFKLSHAKHSNSDILTYFNNLFKIQTTTREQIITFIEGLFFDDYTRNLYNMSYGTSCLKNNIVNSIKQLLSGESPLFTDLRNKRLVFLELLLTPYLKKIANAAHQARNKFPVDEISMESNEICKYFTKSKDPNSSSKSKGGLDGNYLYNIANFYNGLMSHKCCFVNPGSSNPPSEISSIHETHYKRICPITVADMEPGHTVSILPTTVVDWFGNFNV